MPTTHEVAYALFGAYRLARLDSAGMEYFERSPDGALRSFFAAALVLPAYLLLAVLRLWDQLGDMDLLRFVAVEGIAYVISWTAYALAMFHLAQFLGREGKFVDFLCAYNWSAVIQMVIYLPVVVTAQSGLLPDGLGDGMILAVTLTVMAYQWFVTRIALDLPASTAAGLVLLDLILSVFISGIADDLLCAGAGGLAC
ncbi:MAG: hypothetical protein GC191_17390 [Azospirillum sp.]|nr:hypothetical protein [Azospirillum sp.]